MKTPCKVFGGDDPFRHEPGTDKIAILEFNSVTSQGCPTLFAHLLAAPPAAGSPSSFGLKTPLSTLIPRPIVTPPPVSASGWKALRTPPPNGMSPMRWSGTPTLRIRFCTMRSKASALRVAKSVACAAGSACAANVPLPGDGFLFCTKTTEKPVLRTQAAAPGYAGLRWPCPSLEGRKKRYRGQRFFKGRTGSRASLVHAKTHRRCGSAGINRDGERLPQ